MGKDQNFPVSIEVQLLGGKETGDRTTANLCTPGTNVVMNGELVRRHCTGSTSKTYRGDEWVTVEVEVRGGEVIKHIMDGKTVLTYDKPQLDDRDADAKKLIKHFEAEGIKVQHGPFGVYITDGKKNASVPKDQEPADLTLEQCQEIIAKAPEKKKRGRKGAAKKDTAKTSAKSTAKTTKSTAAKKTTAAKSTTKTTAAKKTTAKGSTAKKAPAKSSTKSAGSANKGDA